MTKQSRRQFLGTCSALLGMGLTSTRTTVAESGSAPRGTRSTFRYCLNTSTIRGQKLGLVKEIELAAAAGYQAIEPWVRDVQAYVEQGGSIKDLARKTRDKGLTVESAIGFAQWIVDDPARRAKGLEQAKRDMDLLAQLGGKRLAAPPAGATRGVMLDLMEVARRYRALLELGDQMGVVPQLEVWGFSKNLHRLGQSVFAMIESGHPRACLLPDVYHIYKGGSEFTGLKLLSAEALQVIHMNDYPADPPRDTIGDRDRVFPGDGVAPLDAIIQDLHQVNPTMVLSLELFNPSYWKQDAMVVAQTGLRKMKAAVERALG